MDTKDPRLKTKDKEGRRPIRLCSGYKKIGKSIVSESLKIIIYEQAKGNQAGRDIGDEGGDEYRLQRIDCLARQNL